MAISPVELRHERPALRLIGYSRADVDQLIGDATDAYEAVWRERADLDDRVHFLEQKLESFTETEEALRNALISAEKVADERRAQASRDGELAVREAEVRAREILHGAYAERERVRQETAELRGQEAEFRLRLRSLLGTTLQTVRDHEEHLMHEPVAVAPAIEGTSSETETDAPQPD
jgi:cell division initiation protein